VLHDVFARQPEMRTAVDEVRAHRASAGMASAARPGVVPPDTDQRSAPAGSRKRPSRALVATAAALVLALGGGLGFAARSGWRDTAGGTTPEEQATTPSVREKALPSAKPTFLLPGGKVQRSDSLAVAGFWEAKSVQEGRTYCKFADDRLQIQTVNAGVWLCQNRTTWS
jgi:eukaryotic-like serine/threonine-protein kinase